MGSYYYPAFDVFRVDAAGDRVVLASETVDVYNVTAAVSLGTLTSDADGIVAEGVFSSDIDDVIEISHATYPLTCRFVIAETQEEAYTRPENDVAAYLAENLYADTTTSRSGALYIEDLDNLDVKPYRLATVKAGVDNLIPLQSNIPKNYRLKLFSLDDNLQTSGADFSTAPFADIAIPATTGAYQPLDATLTALAGLTITQGVLPFGSGADTFAVLAKDTNATRYLSNQGTSNNPSWNQVNLANGVTSVLPVANGGHTSQELTRTVPTTVNDYVEIGNIAPAVGASVLRISVVVEGSGISLGQVYLITTRYDSTSNTWRNVIAYHESNYAPATASVSVDINGNAGTTSFRLRRTVGTTACTAKVRVELLGDTTVSFTATTGTGSMSAPTVAYGKTVYGGTYTPTLGATWSGNVSASTAYLCQYMRVDNIVTVSGKITIDPTSTGDTYLGISLPVAMSGAFGEEYLAGTAFTDEIAGQGARVYLLNTDALLRWVAVDTASRDWSFHFTYLIA